MILPRDCFDCFKQVSSGRTSRNKLIARITLRVEQCGEVAKVDARGGSLAIESRSDGNERSKLDGMARLHRHDEISWWFVMFFGSGRIEKVVAGAALVDEKCIPAVE